MNIEKLSQVEFSVAPSMRQGYIEVTWKHEDKYAVIEMPQKYYYVAELMKEGPRLLKLVQLLRAKKNLESRMDSSGAVQEDATLLEELTSKLEALLETF